MRDKCLPPQETSKQCRSNTFFEQRQAKLERQTDSCFDQRSCQTKHAVLSKKNLDGPRRSVVSTSPPQLPLYYIRFHAKHACMHCHRYMCEHRNCSNWVVTCSTRSLQSSEGSTSSIVCRTRCKVSLHHSWKQLRRRASSCTRHASSWDVVVNQQTFLYPKKPKNCKKSKLLWNSFQHAFQINLSSLKCWYTIFLKHL